MDNIIHLDGTELKKELKELLRGSVEETLNRLLDEEADRITQASRYERSPDRVDTRAGHYKQKLLTTSGEVELRVPKLRKLRFETAIIERYKRRECSVEEALIEMYLAGVSVRRVEDITEALWGTKVSPGTVSELNKKAYVDIERWRNRPLTKKYPYVYLDGDGIYLKQNWGGEYENVSILVALAVDEEGYREIIGACEGAKEDTASWTNFLRHLKERGLAGTPFADIPLLFVPESAGPTCPVWNEARRQAAFSRRGLSCHGNRRFAPPYKAVQLAKTG